MGDQNWHCHRPLALVVRAPWIHPQHEASDDGLGFWRRFFRVSWRSADRKKLWVVHVQGNVMFLEEVLGLLIV